MPPLSPRSRRILLALSVALIALAAYGAIHFLRNRSALPQPGTPRYEEYAEAFQVGTAALDSALLNQIALDRLTEAIELIPQEPAALVNRGICYLRIGNPEALKNAEMDLQRAKSWRPATSPSRNCTAIWRNDRGDFPRPSPTCAAALEGDPENVLLLYKLSELIAKEDTAAADDERQKLLDRILAVRPKSLFTLSERAGLAVRLRDQKTLRDTVNRLSGLSGDWHADTLTARWPPCARILSPRRCRPMFLAG